MMPSVTNNEHLYKRLFVAKLDLSQAYQLAAFILKKGWHHKPWERRGTVYLQQSAFTTSLIIFYSRAFNNSKGLPPFPEGLLTNFNQTEKEFHHKIRKDLRDRIYAHSDDISYKVQPIDLGGHPSDILATPFFMLSEKETKRLQRMIGKVLKSISVELERLHPLSPKPSNHNVTSAAETRQKQKRGVI